MNTTESDKSQPVPILKPCLCGNFGDDGPDDWCEHKCEEEEEK